MRRLTLSLCFLLAALFLTATPAQAQRFVVGEVSAIKGQPEVAHETFGRRLVIPGSAVYGNDLVKTDANSYVVISFFDGTYLKIGSGTQLRVTKFVYDGERNIAGAQIDLLVGQLRLWAEKKLKGELLQVRTTNAVAGVRGTEFELGFRPGEESTVVAVFEGKVFFFNRQIGREEGQEIPKNHWGEIKGGKPPGKPKSVDQMPAGFAPINR